MANYLTKLRTDPKYFHAKAHMETALESIPVVGNSMVKLLQDGKKLVRRGIYIPPCSRRWGSSISAC